MWASAQATGLPHCRAAALLKGPDPSRRVSEAQGLYDPILGIPVRSLCPSTTHAQGREIRPQRSEGRTSKQCLDVFENDSSNVLQESNVVTLWKKNCLDYLIGIIVHLLSVI